MGFGNIFHVSGKTFSSLSHLAGVAWLLYASPGFEGTNSGCWGLSGIMIVISYMIGRD